MEISFVKKKNLSLYHFKKNHGWLYHKQSGFRIGKEDGGEFQQYCDWAAEEADVDFVAWFSHSEQVLLHLQALN